MSVGKVRQPRCLCVESSLKDLTAETEGVEDFRPERPPVTNFAPKSFGYAGSADVPSALSAKREKQSVIFRFRECGLVEMRTRRPRSQHLQASCNADRLLGKTSVQQKDGCKSGTGNLESARAYG
jgi:hypothetical protein